MGSIESMHVSTSAGSRRVCPALRLLPGLSLLGLCLQLPAQDLQFKQSTHSDKQIFAAARGTEDASAKVAALQSFVRAYPQSHLVERAQWEVFSTLVKRLPQRLPAIQSQARLLISHADAGLDSIETRAEIADSLANAGVDLTDAESWASSAAASLTEARWQQWQRDQHQAPADAAAQAESGRQFHESRAEVLAALANVQWHQGKVQATAATLREAAALDPDSDEVNALSGEVAYAAHQPAVALDAYERAQLAGELQPLQHEHFLAAYRDTHDGRLDGLEQALDARYATSYPLPIPRQPAPSEKGNRTVLVELYTGAGCPPCTAADLALEGVQNNYSRQQVVVLAFDQHIPRPDPLATPQTVARAKWYGILGTPTFYVDGRQADVDGGGRSHALATYQALSRSIQQQLSTPAPLALTAQATQNAEGKVQVQIRQTASSQDQLLPPADLHVALVEDHVRYSGQNGIRFHEALVRALSHADGTATASRASFDIPALERQQRTYLDAYEQHNDRYGPIQFLNKDIPLDPRHLAVVVFAQDPVTKMVAQARYIPLTPPAGT